MLDVKVKVYVQCHCPMSLLTSSVVCLYSGGGVGLPLCRERGIQGAPSVAVRCSVALVIPQHKGRSDIDTGHSLHLARHLLSYHYRTSGQSSSDTIWSDIPASLDISRAVESRKIWSSSLPPSRPLANGQLRVKHTLRCVVLYRLSFAECYLCPISSHSSTCRRHHLLCIQRPAKG